jgi:hypothetical protein
VNKFFSLLGLFFIISCSTILNQSKVDLHQNILFTSSAEFSKIFNYKDSELWHRVLNFKTPELAVNYFLQRRLDLQRLYELTSEPYFGTPKQKDCKDNIDISAKILPLFNGLYYQLKMLENENFALGDCLVENNKMVAVYEFYQCKNIVYEVRWHRPYGLPALDLPSFICP